MNWTGQNEYETQRRLERLAPNPQRHALSEDHLRPAGHKVADLIAKYAPFVGDCRQLNPGRPKEYSLEQAIERKRQANREWWARQKAKRQAS
jgi:hypothetical protein